MRILAAVLVLLAPSVVQAETAPVRLKNGASWTQTIVKTRTDERDGASQAVTVTTVLRVTYTDGKPARLNETFVSLTSDDLPADMLQYVASQAKLVFPAVIEVDESLKPTRVVNWAELKSALDRMDGDPKVTEAVRATFGAIDDRAAASLFREQGLVSLGQGVDLPVGETQEYEGQAPNILGGPPIGTQGQFKLESYDKSAGRAVVTWRQALEPVSMAASIRTMVESLAAKVAPERLAQAKAELSVLTLDRQDACRYEIDLHTGLAAKSDCTVMIASGVPGKIAKRTEHWIITQSAPEPR